MPRKLNRPVPFPGTPEQALNNYHTHHWSSYDGESTECSRCCSKPWHVAAEYPCGQEPPREDVEIPDNPTAEEFLALAHPGLAKGL